MRINFFEEFPTEANLKKAKLITFPSIIYIAAKSLEEFRAVEKRLYKINKKVEAGYWPLLEKSYWISPFSYIYELKDLIRDLKHNKKKLKVLIDLELPFLNPKLFLRNLFSFIQNKRLIKKLFKDARKSKIEILTAEYPISNKLLQKKLEWFGVSYPINKFPHKKIVMLYSSVIKSKIVLSQMKKFISKKSKEYGKNLQVGLGTIAKGILGTEPLLSPKQLDRDLKFLKENNIKEATIFRLGGLNKEYLKVIRRYAH